MSWEVRYHPDVAARDVPSINRDMRGRIERAIRGRLMSAPERYGHPLRGTLKGEWKLRVEDYRVVFRMVGSEVRIFAVAHRRDVYESVPRRLAWSGNE